jgi:thiol-disulfide isomerase/thioredoxin
MIGSRPFEGGEGGTTVKKKAIGIIVSALIAIIPFFATGAENPIVLFFYAEGCPDCMAIDELLTALSSDLPPAALSRYEISDPKASGLLEKLKAAYGIGDASVPIVFVGDDVVVGAGKAQEFKLRDAIGHCATLGCPSPLTRVRPPVTADDLIRLAVFAAALVILAIWQLHHR